MRKIIINSIILSLLLVGCQYKQPAAVEIKPVIEEKSIDIEAKPSIDLTVKIVPAENKNAQKIVKIDSNKIINLYSQAPHALKFTSSPDGYLKNASWGAIDIYLFGNDDSDLDSVHISIPFLFREEDYYHALKIFGEFAGTIDPNIVTNDNQILKRMIGQLKPDPNHLNASSIVDGLDLTMSFQQDKQHFNNDKLTFFIFKRDSTIFSSISTLNKSATKRCNDFYCIINGEIINNSGNKISSAKIKLILCDDKNNVLDFHYLDDLNLDSGSKVPFSFNIDNQWRTKGYDHYEILIVKYD